MEVDSAHSVIERKVKGMCIYSPENYIQVMEATNYEVRPIDHTFFHDYTGIRYYNSIRSGRSTGDPQVTDLVALKYTPAGELEYKLNFKDEWQLLPTRPKAGEYQNTIKSLHEAPLRIKTRKF
jgi:hypothetical protein